MARFSLTLLLVLHVTYKSWGLVLETPRHENLRNSGGETIPIAYAPYTAALFYASNQICGATIIDEQFVLTAAHCLVTNNTEDWKILVGSDQLNTEGVFIEVEKILCHEGYFTGPEHDICLLKLKENVPFGCLWTVDKVALPKDDRTYYGDFWAAVSGWGQTENRNLVSKELRQAIVPVVSNECCRRVHSYVTDDMICAGDRHQNFCMGDTGGPLVLQNSDTKILIGIASQVAISCGSYPGVYTRVASYLPWIRDTMKNNRV